MNRSTKAKLGTLLIGLLPIPGLAELEIKRFNPEGMSQPVGYSQVVTVKGSGKMIFLGGKAGIYPDDTFPETLEEQSELTFKNIRRALEAAGATPADVVDIEIFIVDLFEQGFQAVFHIFRSGRRTHQNLQNLIGVQAVGQMGDCAKDLALVVAF